MSSSAKRALKILATSAEAGRPMGVTEIARAIGTPPGTAFRGLDALTRAGLLARHPSAPRYVLGPAALALRQSLLAQFPIREVCLPYLRQLASASGEGTSLHVRIGWYAGRIATAPGAGEMTSGSGLGGVALLSAGIAGRAILAHLERNQTARYRAWATARGFVIARELERDLDAIGECGFAQGSTGAIAVPIRLADQAFAALAVDGPGIAAGSAKAARGIAGAIEAVVRANPALARQPFAHLDPDEVILPLDLASRRATLS